jgi:hypothetical protein
VAIYEQSPNVFVLARADDLLHLDVEVDADRNVLTLFLPAQNVMEFPFPAPTGYPLFVPVPAAIGFESSSFVRYPIAAGKDAAALAGSVLERFDAQPGTAGVDFPMLMFLEPLGQSTWRLNASPRTGDGWTAVWQAELLATSDAVPGLVGPFMVATSTQSQGGEPLSFGVAPFVLFPQLKGSIFQTRLALSMLGASGRIHGPHPAPGAAPTSVQSYEHVSQLGRDQQMTAVVRGFLSSGHPATLELVTTRVFTQTTATGAFTGPIVLGEPAKVDSFEPVRGQTYFAAHLFQTATLTVLQQEVRFEGADTPFRTLRLAEERIGQVDPKVSVTEPFWVTRGGADVRFALVATDWEGREVPFAAPLMFRLENVAGDSLQEVFRSGDAGRRRIDLGGMPVALADRSGHDDVPADAVTLPVHALELELASIQGVGSAIVPATVDVALDAVARLTGSTGVATCKLLHRLDEARNFLTIAEGLPVSFPAAQVGGLASPNAVLGAVNAIKGAIPTGSVAEVFGKANLLGAPLAPLLAEAQRELPVLNSVELPDSIETRYRWSPALNIGRDDGVIRLAKGSTLSLEATLTQPLDPSAGQPRPPSARVEGTLTKVTLSLLDVILVSFEKVRFLNEPNATPSVSATGCAVSFAGDLEFVQKLAKEIADFASGCPVKVDSSGISAGYTLAIPGVAFGVFSLTDISLGAEVRIPFTGDPASVRFNFSERDAPFTVGVSLFAGDGFFAVTATTDKLERVEGSLEFGGNFEIGVLVATGRVFAMGGVSFLRGGDVVRLEGYLHCGGNLEILDVVGVSVEFQMGLAYTDEHGSARVHGSATLTVGVDLLAFSESVSFTVERSFSVSDGRAHPVEEQIDAAVWEQLCDAYV